MGPITFPQKTILMVLFFGLATVITHAAPLVPDLTQLKVTGKKPDGEEIREPGTWHDPALNEQTWKIANDGIQCLVDALAKYDSKVPADIDTKKRKILDKYYGLNVQGSNADLLGETKAEINKLRIGHVKIFGDNLTPEGVTLTSTAYTRGVKTGGKTVQGLFFTGNYYNLHRPPAEHLSVVRRGMSVLHESTHAIIGTADYWEIKGKDDCKKSTKRKFIESRTKPVEEQNIYCAYWRDDCKVGLEKIWEMCHPFVRLATADMTVAAAYHCLYGKPPSATEKFKW